MAQCKRSQRVAELLREELGQIITQKLRDPLIGLVTVTAIKLTDDLKSARVYVSLIGGDEDGKKKSLRGLARASKWIRTELGHRMNLRYVPKLVFEYDETLDYADNIESLINLIKSEDDEPSNANPTVLDT